MNDNERTLNELIEIKKLLFILSNEKRIEFSKTIEKQFLTTIDRKKMYDLFDGTKSLKEISEEVGSTSEAVRLFAASLEKAGYLEYIATSKSKNPKKIY